MSIISMFPQVEEGLSLNLSDITATASDVLKGKNFINSNGELIPGGMDNRGSVEGILTASSTGTSTYSIPAGYHDGSGTVALSTINLTLDASSQMLSGYTAIGKNGKLITGDIDTYSTIIYYLDITTTDFKQKAIPKGYHDGYTFVRQPIQSIEVVPTQDDQIITPDSGYLLSSVTITGDSDLKPENIKSNTSIFGITGTAETKWEWGDESIDEGETWWEGLKEWISAATDAELATCLGKTKQVTLTSAVLGTTTHLIMCVGYNNAGLQSLTFQTKNCLANSCTFGTSNNYFTTSNTVPTNCQNYYNAFPYKSYLLSVQPEVLNSDGTGYGTSGTYVFLPSIYEMGFSLKTSDKTANTHYNANYQYQYYTTNTSRYKYIGDSSTSYASSYWTRSDYSTSSIYVVSGSAGSSTTTSYSNYRYLAPAFVVGGTKTCLAKEIYDGSSGSFETIELTNNQVLHIASNTFITNGFLVTGGESFKTATLTGSLSSSYSTTLSFTTNISSISKIHSMYITSTNTNFNLVGCLSQLGLVSAYDSSNWLLGASTVVNYNYYQIAYGFTWGSGAMPLSSFNSSTQKLTITLPNVNLGPASMGGVATYWSAFDLNGNIITYQVKLVYEE